jgi:hypothetical protein
MLQNKIDSAIAKITHSIKKNDCVVVHPAKLPGISTYNIVSSC